MDAEAEREFRDFVAARSAALFRSAYLLTGQRGAAGKVLSEREIGVPGREYASVVLVPHRGPLPPGALGL